MDVKTDVSSAARGFLVVPSDSVDLPHPTRGIYVGVTGDIAVNLYDGDAVTFVGVAPGTILPVKATRIKATGTTAASLIALY